MDEPRHSDTPQNPYMAPSGGPSTAPFQTKKRGSKIYPPFQYGFASRWKRFVGNIIDTLILFGGMVAFAGLGGAVFFVLFPESAENVDEESLGFAVVANALAIAGLALSFLLFNGYLLAKHGQTVGKAILGMRIVHEDGRIPTLARMFFLRYVSFWVLSLIPGIGTIFNIGNALAIFRATHKCLHDDLASTIVINTVPPVKETQPLEHGDNWN